MKLIRFIPVYQRDNIYSKTKTGSILQEFQQLKSPLNNQELSNKNRCNLKRTDLQNPLF